jgi:hypothetical protein
MGLAHHSAEIGRLRPNGPRELIEVQVLHSQAVTQGEASRWAMAFVPGGYGLIRAGVRTDSMIGAQISNTTIPRTSSTRNTLDAPDHTVPYGTVLSEDAFPGTSCQACHEQAIARRMATIMLSLRDEIHSSREALIKLALVGLP